MTSPEESGKEIMSSLPPRISDVAAVWAERMPEHPALVDEGGTWTYGQLALRIAETKQWLADLRVRPGDRVAVVCENCREFVAILLGLAALDAWPVLVNARLSAREVDQVREHSRARLTLYTTGKSAQARQHAKRHGAAFEERIGLGSIAVGGLDESAEPEKVEADIPNRVAALIYTSGTTGMPKGVMLTHRGLLFVAGGSARIRSLVPEDRLYGVLPMSHAVGLSVVLLGSLLSGATLYLSQRFDPVAALTALEQQKLTVLLGAPSLFSILLDYVAMKGLSLRNFPALRIISSSGAPLQPPVKAAVEAAFGMVLHNGYGVTECSPNIAQTRPESPRTDTSVGQIMPGMEAKLLGIDGEQTGEGEVGELRVRGPNIMKGYYRAPQETAAAVDAEGWFNTRDLARIEGNHLFIVGRTKELIVRFGLNVYPSEVESVLNTHPAVVRSAVIGRTVEGVKGGEEVIAFIEAAAGVSRVSAADLADHAARHLAPYKRPSEILFVPSMPLTPTGKVIKEELSGLALTGSSVL